ncbi:MAG: LamG-like jellyroll fold domain-containing protein [Bacteroidia bacterium]
MKKVLFFISVTISVLLKAQSGLLASYYFNSGNANDDIGPYNGTVIGATLTNDRFGNPNHAYYFWGIPNSYIKLTTSNIIKQSVESISMWVKVDTASYLGNGSTYNPILVTKCQSGNNYFEAYSLYYSPSNSTLITIETQPTSNEKYFFSNPLNLHSWYHVVLSYDNDSIGLYVNSVLQQKMYKGFTSVFLSADSVMLGNEANTQNNRFFHGAIDDIGFYDHVLSQHEIDTLYNVSNPTTGIKTNYLETNITLFPNPIKNELKISSNEKVSNYKIISLLGEVMLQGKLNQSLSTVDLSQMQSGVYFIEFESGNGSSITKKIIKE